MAFSRAALLPETSPGLEEQRRKMLRIALQERIAHERQRLSAADQQGASEIGKMGRPTGLMANDAQGYSDMLNRQREISDISRSLGGKAPMGSKGVYEGNQFGMTGVLGDHGPVSQGFNNAPINQNLAAGLPIPTSQNSLRNNELQRAQFRPMPSSEMGLEELKAKDPEAFRELMARLQERARRRGGQ